MHPFIKIFAGVVVALTAALAFAHGYTVGKIDIAHPYSVPTPPGATTGGAYIHALTNKGTTEDRLVGVTTPAADHVELHSMAMDGNVMRMREVAGGIPLPAGGQVEMAPGGGYHLMMIGIKQPLKVGDKIPGTLKFEKAGTVDVVFDVQERGAAPEKHMH